MLLLTTISRDFFSKFKYLDCCCFWVLTQKTEMTRAEQDTLARAEDGPTLARPKVNNRKKNSRNFEEFLNIIFKEKKSGRLVINPSSYAFPFLGWYLLTIWEVRKTEDFTFKLWSRIRISKQKFKVSLISKSSYSPNMQLLHCVGN